MHRRSLISMLRRGSEEITYSDLVGKIKEMQIPFKAPDIADLAAQYLGEKGVKVWR